MNKKGYFVTFEGPEGSGKSTQARALAEHLRQSGLSVIFSREPGGTEVGERIRDIVHDTEIVNMAPTTEALLYQASRAQHVYELINPSLEAGVIVILDRFGDSSEVYQGAGRGFGIHTIREFNNFSTGGLRPDLTFLVDIEVHKGLLRKGKTDEVNRMDMQPIDFYETVRNAYQTLIEEDQTGRWVRVDGSKPIGEVKREVIEIAEERLIARGIMEGNRLRGPERF